MGVLCFKTQSLAKNKNSSSNKYTISLGKKKVPSSGSGLETKNSTCIGCSQNISLEVLKLVCGKNHYIGVKCGCATNFLNTIFEDPEGKFPIKCPQCPESIATELIEKVLQSSGSPLLEKFRVIMMMRTCQLLPGEIMVTCPFCYFMEIRDFLGINFIFCQNPLCQKRYCFFCRKESAFMDEENYDTHEDLELFSHFECAKMAEAITYLENAVDRGQKVSCPKCGRAGMKDDGCTHITCDKCYTVFCYICGMDEKFCDKANPKGNIYSHNEDWKINQKRCPMYLSMISEIDSKWSEQEKLALEKLMRIKLLKEIKKAIQHIGKEKFWEIEKKFSFLAKYNLSYEEIEQVPENVFKRLI